MLHDIMKTCASHGEIKMIIMVIIIHSHSTAIALNAIGLALWSGVGLTDNTG